MYEISNEQWEFHHTQETRILCGKPPHYGDKKTTGSKTSDQKFTIWDHNTQIHLTTYPKTYFLVPISWSTFTTQHLECSNEFALTFKGMQVLSTTQNLIEWIIESFWEWLSKLGFFLMEPSNPKMSLRRVYIGLETKKNWKRIFNKKINL